MITLKQAKALKKGDIIIDLRNKTKDGKPAKWKLIANSKTWVKDESKVLLSVKFGLHQYDKISEEYLSEFKLLKPLS